MNVLALLTLAPLLINSLTVSASPLAAALCNGV